MCGFSLLAGYVKSYYLLLRINITFNDAQSSGIFAGVLMLSHSN